MSTRIDGRIYYRTSEACQRAGISRATLFRWLKTGVLDDAMRRDRKGWRLFTQDDIDKILIQGGLLRYIVGIYQAVVTPYE